jgi:hypothetical protein
MSGAASHRSFSKSITFSFRHLISIECSSRLGTDEVPQVAIHREAHRRRWLETWSRVVKGAAS